MFFSGKGFTGKGRVSDLVMLRAAELTLAHGFTHFTILAEAAHTERSQSVGDPAGVSVGLGINEPTATKLIQSFRKPPDDVETYDAQFVYDSVRKKYIVPCSSGGAILLWAETWWA